MAKLSIVVPTYNEKDNLGILVERIHRALSPLDYELIVVDDNSPDGTGDLAEELARDRPITVVHRAGKLGLASAVIDGFRHANGDVLGVIDADLQHPPEMLPKLFQAMEGADVVIGSRYLEGGGVEDWTFFREVISRGAKLAPQFLFAKIRSVTDPLSGFFMFRKQVIEDVELNPIGYKILLEILVKGKHNGVAEIPFVFTGRKLGTSNLTFKEDVNYLRHLYRLTNSEGEVRRFIKYGLVGASGVLVNLGVLALLTENVGLFYAVSAVIGIEASIINNFVWNETWTFRDRRTKVAKSIVSRAAKFNLVSLLSLGINIGILLLLTEVVGMHYLVSEMFGIVAAMMFNFVFNKWWTWQ